MGSTFNPLILIEKLVKLNSSQQSIETLSHWCIFHMNKAKYVVETWDKQFHSSPREQRLAFLYLANDILQNSRRKGSEFVGEFWKVLPDALRDVLDNGNEFDKNSAQRLINIWEERKVFGSRGQLLKEELVSGRNLEIFNKDESPPGFKLRNSAGNAMDKIVSAYQVLSGGQLDEETIMHKCKNAIRCIEKVDKNISSDIRSEELIGYDIVEEIRGQQATLISCIKQLTAMESCRTNLVSNLTEALREQEFKLNHVRHQLQVAESQSEHAENLCKQILNKTVHLPSERPKEGHTTEPPQSFMAGIGEQTAPLVYIQEALYSDKSGQLEDNSKSAVAAVPSELTAITSSAQIPTYVLSDGVIVNSVKEPSDNYPPGKKPKLENDHPLYSQSQKVQPPVPPFPHPNSLQHHVTMTSGELIPLEQPPLPSSPPPMPPLPPLPPMNQYPVPQFMQNAVPVPVLPYGYGSIQQQPRPLLFPAIGTPFNANLNFLAPPGIPFQNYPNEGGFYGPQPSLPTAPASRQF